MFNSTRDVLRKGFWYLNKSMWFIWGCNTWCIFKLRWKLEEYDSVILCQIYVTFLLQSLTFFSFFLSYSSWELCSEVFQQTDFFPSWIQSSVKAWLLEQGTLLYTMRAALMQINKYTLQFYTTTFFYRHCIFTSWASFRWTIIVTYDIKWVQHLSDSVVHNIGAQNSDLCNLVIYTWNNSTKEL